MRIVLDTNILLSALLTRRTPPDQLYEEWRHGRFDLASAEQQLEELNQVSRRPFFLSRLKPSEVGRMVNDIRRLALMCDPLPSVTLSPDPNDDFLLAISQVAKADYLVTGDKNDLLALKTHGSTRITTARELLQLLR
ncbi:MAG: putative toxin-antitoxin system toxin component, PIN family [Methylobacter sp.]|nr:putative toxin-antitoxin system toxin component, PIN family [Methylobacter sp.]MDP2100536.1 putative toxin-antitoxin system toxin component, PIN family [Methylobacter sp.]MDP2428711.1 putative toxin-antitoxin system toxin component, PIN family [Methylobacter sp.]MDP3053273.1 putative toxin-antitoxin system toxin component, PIN family [Methylobacter sp.]MDP3361528.1 putative toxin-antitoxin system toxin component, PIN family [Methylobacter sp.]